MSTFDNCLQFTLKMEGGNSDDPHDPGGRTSRGVTQRTYDAWRHKKGLETQDVWAMSDQECHDIYEEEYWTPSHCDALEPSVALYVFDMSVNMGITHSVETLQKACGATVDGAFGPETLSKSGSMDLNDLIAALHSDREAYYRSLSNFDRYGRGWLNRNDNCAALAYEWAM
jgi:lysozyme family protein